MKGLTIQGEYIYTLVKRPHNKNPDFSGCYVGAGIFLTGEKRAFSRGRFTRLKPKNNFLDGKGGLGAWEIAARYSYTGLNDSGIEGGSVKNATAALNWYLNPNTRVMVNYVFSHRRCVGDAHMVMWRFQVDF